MAFYQKLLELFQSIHNSERFLDVFPELEAQILQLFSAERITIYQRSYHSQDIYSRFKTGSELTEIRVPIGPQSIAGYVALSKKSVLIKDAYDEQELHLIHPKLNFARQFDQKSGFRTRSVLAVPITEQNVLLGVIQLINAKTAAAFSQEDCDKAMQLAQLLGQKFRYELGATRGPFDYLQHRNLISASQLQQLNQPPKDFATQVSKITTDYRISKEQLGLSLEAFYQVSFIGFEPDKYQLHALNSKLNRSYLLKNHLVILEDQSGKVVIVLTNPNHADTLMEVERATGLLSYDIHVALPDDIDHYIKGQQEDNLTELGDLLNEADDDLTLETLQQEDEGISEETPVVVKLVNRVLMDAQRLNASDIHIESGKGKSSCRVRLRIDGECRELIQIPPAFMPPVVSRIKIMARLDIAEKRLPQDGKFSVKLANKIIEVRVATLPTVFGEGVVMRILASGEALPFDKLQLSPRNYQMMSQMIKHPHGVLLVVGPTGSGKTTTLHAILGQLNTTDKKIWTAEDPVEITQPGLQQVQMNNKSGLTFAVALRAFLRADPDIILIGEMRDKETAHAGIEASLTGHLVLSTLHTNSAPETITRLIDIGIDPINFADACIGILAQRLVRTLCTKCKEAYQPDQIEQDYLKRHYGLAFAPELGLKSPLTLHKAKGCPACEQTGYKGRVGVHELLPVTTKVRQLIYHKASIEQIQQQAIADGMRTLVQDGILKVLSGVTDFKQLQAISVFED